MDDEKNPYPFVEVRAESTFKSLSNSLFEISCRDSAYALATALKHKPTGETVLAISYPGSGTEDDWGQDFKSMFPKEIILDAIQHGFSKSADPDDKNGCCVSGSGFVSRWKDLKKDLKFLDKLEKKIKESGTKFDKIYVVGHSLGGAIAALSYPEIVKRFDNLDIPIIMSSVGAPRVFAEKDAVRFHKQFAGKNSDKHRAYRFVNFGDCVTFLPMRDRVAGWIMGHGNWMHYGRAFYVNREFGLSWKGIKKPWSLREREQDFTALGTPGCISPKFVNDLIGSGSKGKIGIVMYHGLDEHASRAKKIREEAQRQGLDPMCKKKMYCGEKGCWSTNGGSCKNAMKKSLDPDKDKDDLYNCPSEYKDAGYCKKSSWWGKKYLRKCERREFSPVVQSEYARTSTLVHEGSQISASMFPSTQQHYLLVLFVVTVMCLLIYSIYRKCAKKHLSSTEKYLLLEEEI